MSTDLLENLSYEELLAELGCRMSRISEEATCSGWHDRIDDELPRLCREIVRTNQPGAFDTTIISVLEARLLVLLADRLGHWVTRKAGRRGWIPHVPKSLSNPAGGAR